MKHYFEAGNFFLLRSPEYAFDKYNSIACGEMKCLDDLKEMQEAFKEALIISTHDLLPMMLDRNELSFNVQKAIVKYFIRGTTRATPFGLFAGVALGQFGKHTNLQLGAIEHDKKRGRVDLGWLYCIIKAAEDDIEILECLKIRYNSMCYKKGNRYINPFFTNAGSLSVQECQVSIKASKMTDMVFHRAKSFVTFKDLLNDIQKNNTEVDSEIIRKFLKDLVWNEYLITELRPPLINTDAMEYVMNKLSNIKAAAFIYEKLIEIRNALHQYNTTSIGAGSLLYNQICFLMESLHKNDDYIQVDVAKKIIKKNLGESVKKEAENIINMLASITNFGFVPEHLVEYKQAFLDKYGYSIAVPILELMDEDLGLGAPAGYSMPVSRRQILRTLNSQNDKLDSLMRDKIIYAIKNQLPEVNILEEELVEIQYDNTKYNIPISLEIYVEILAEQEQDIDADKFRLLLSGVRLASAAGKTLGRFGDIVDENVGEYIYKREEELLPHDTLLVEISEMPRVGRIGNVVGSQSEIPIQLSLITNSCSEKEFIEISDIYVGVDANGRFYAISRSMGKKLLFKSTNMLNPTYGSNVFRFLREISFGYTNGLAQTVRKFQDFNGIYTPRIVFGKTILNPAQWIIPFSSIKKQSIQEFNTELRTFSEKWKMPRFVNYGNSDNQLLLDLNNLNHVGILLSECKKQHDIVLKEAFHNNPDTNVWMKDLDGNLYINEFVIPFFKLRKLCQNKTDKQDGCSVLGLQKPVSNLHQKIYKNRLLPFEDKWIYFKLYQDTLRTNELIMLINELGNRMVKECLIEKYFYIQYADPNPHIRFRVRVVDLESSLHLIQSWLNEVREIGIVYDVKINSYEKEIYRYGGEALINIAETFFYFDSCVIGNIIQLYEDNQNDDFLGMTNILMIMEGFGLNNYSMLEWMSSYLSIGEFRKEFKQNRNKILEIIQKYNINKKELIDIIPEIEMRHKVLCDYKKNIDDLDNQGILTNTKEDILSSLIHMSCNRFKGDNIWENKIRALIRHGLYAFLQQKKWR